MIHLQYTLTEKEFLDYNFYTCWQTPEKRNKRLMYYFLTPLLYLVVLGYIFYGSNKGGFDNVSIYIGVIGLIILIFFTRFRIKARFDKQALDMIRSSGPDTVLADMELIVSETGIAGKTRVAEIKYLWDAIQKKIIANDCYYLYVNARQGIIIPFRVFKTITEKESFEKMLAQYLSLQADLVIPTK